MLVVMPLITMRLFAEERMNQTLTLLTSSPLSSTQIVLGKYFSVLGFVLLFVGLLALMPMSLSYRHATGLGAIGSGGVGADLVVGGVCGGGCVPVIAVTAAGDCGGHHFRLFAAVGCVVPVGAFAGARVNCLSTCQPLGISYRLWGACSIAVTWCITCCLLAGS